MLLIGSRQQLSKIALPSATVGQSLIAPTTTAMREFGGVFDTLVTLFCHPNALSQSARCHIRNIGKSGDSSTATRARRLSMPLLRRASMDLNNALLAGLPHDTVANLLKSQNIAERVVIRSRIKYRNKHVLVELHWLPVEQRIQ